MTIDSIINLPVISVEFYPRVSDLTNLNAYIYNKATRIDYVVGVDNISYSANVATITLTDAALIASIDEDSVLSIVFYVETDSSTYLDSLPIYRDLITFKSSLDTDSSYLQDSGETEYIFA
jgi:hypothetical protein